jgi:hypothetical protein
MHNNTDFLPNKLYQEIGETRKYQPLINWNKTLDSTWSSICFSIVTTFVSNPSCRSWKLVSKINKFLKLIKEF